MNIRKKGVVYFFASVWLILVFPFFASAWIEPTTIPPGNNIFAPLNSSSFGQSKIGGLLLNIGKAAHGLIVRYGLVGIGTDNPQAILDVSSTESGVLLPRTTPDKIVSPKEGMLIFNTAEKEKRFNVFSNNSWQPVGSQNIITVEYANGDGGVGDAYCKKKNITNDGIQEGWININNNRPCGATKICENGNCIVGPICGIDLYRPSSSCVAVGTGYYSPNRDNFRYACTNKPANSTYTGSGGGTNNCPWACNTDYYKNGTVCSPVGTGNYSPNLNNNLYACTNKPANSFYTGSGGGTNNCPWSCNSDYYWNGSICDLSCRGKMVGGYCWYLASYNGQSCNSFCASHGGCNQNGILNWAGTLGSQANCNQVSMALIGQGAPNNGTQWGGCALHMYGQSWWFHWGGINSTCSDTNGNMRKFCSCYH